MKAILEHKIAAAKYNNLLLINLGENPPFTWRWSEELTVGVKTGTEQVANPVTGVIELRPVYFQRKQLLFSDRQWVMTARLPFTTEEQWLKEFGWDLQYDPNQVQPVTDAFGAVIAMPRMQPPDRKTTEDFIEGIRMRRGMSEADYQQMLEAAETARRHDSDEKLMAAIDKRTSVMTLDPKLVFPGVGDGSNKYTN